MVDRKGRSFTNRDGGFLSYKSRVTATKCIPANKSMRWYRLAQCLIMACLLLTIVLMAVSESSLFSSADMALAMLEEFMYATSMDSSTTPGSRSSSRPPPAVVVPTNKNGELVRSSRRRVSRRKPRRPHGATTENHNDSHHEQQTKRRGRARPVQETDALMQSTVGMTTEDVAITRRSLQEQSPALSEQPMQELFYDPLRTDKFATPRGTRLPIKPATPYLGVLLDAGRHYFPPIWIKRLLDRLSDMNYNLLHFRLTDDQTFNVLLDSYPQLAYPSAVNNPERKVYTADELRDITDYANERGISIMPEINVPGHAGSWSGIPNLVVQCALFICSRGYGLPLNVDHPDLRTILTAVIKEVVDIFDNPPYLHLGGDEVNMADPCFNEVGIQKFNYPNFEVLLKQIIADSGYPEEKVVRWEMTGQQDLSRAGAIEHFWESHPGVRHDATGPFFVSTWLYFDTNGDQNAFDVYEKTRHNFNLKQGKLPTAIIAGTFELSTEFWYDRNVLGKLLAVAMGASNDKVYTIGASDTREKVMADYKAYCTQLGLGSIICGAEGVGVIPHWNYYAKWQKKWEIWKADICFRLTDIHSMRLFRIRSHHEAMHVVHNGNRFFWENVPVQKMKRADSPPQKKNAVLGQHAVPHTGVILDVTSSMVVPERLLDILSSYVAPLGFNLIQLPLVNNHGFVHSSMNQPSLSHSLLATAKNPAYDLNRDLHKFITQAYHLGINVMPEVSVSTDAAGWFNTGFAMQCPLHFCNGHGLPTAINEPLLLPVLISVIGELYQMFSSKYIHLGTDERQAADPCFREAGRQPKFDKFEATLAKVLKFSEIPIENVVRWENGERMVHPGRVGSITQYRPGMTLPSNATKPGHFFATVDLMEGDGWSVYQRTAELVDKGSHAILASIRTLTEERWDMLHIHKRLLAFALGVSRQNFPRIMDVETFTSNYTSLCETLRWAVDCQPPTRLTEPVVYVTDREEFIRQHCELYTMLQRYYKAKRVIEPFYSNITASNVTRIRPFNGTRFMMKKALASLAPKASTTDQNIKQSPGLVNITNTTVQGKETNPSNATIDLIVTQHPTQAQVTNVTEQGKLNATTDAVARQVERRTVAVEPVKENQPVIPSPAKT